MRIFDASSIIFAWDNYPIGQFPKVWSWLGNEVQQNRICISDIAYNEVKNQDCEKWLKNVGIRRISENNAILKFALEIKSLLKIQNEQYGKGVGEKDILIIATAKIERMDLVSDEGRQTDVKNTKLANYKVPTVCGLPEVNVSCMNFVELFKESESVF